MKLGFLVLLSLALGTIPAYADNGYYDGWNAGYYTGSISSNPGSDYGRGVSDGSFDAYQEDMQAAQKRTDDYVNQRNADQEAAIEWMSKMGHDQ